MLATSFARLVSLLATLLPVAAQHPLIGSLDVVSKPKDVPFVALGDVPDLWDVVIVVHATQDSSGGVSFDICGPPTCPSQDLATSVKSRVTAGRVVQLRISIQSESDDWDPQKFVSGITELVTDNGFNGVDIDVASMGILGIYNCEAVVSKFTTVANALRTAFGPDFVLSVRGSVWVNKDGTFSGTKCNIPVLRALQYTPAISYISVLPPGWIAAPFIALNGTAQISKGPTFMPVFVDDLFEPDNDMRIVSDELGSFQPLLPEKMVIDTAAIITGPWFDPNDQPYWRIAANVESAMTCIMNGTDEACAMFGNKPKNPWPGLRAITGMPINIDQRIQDGAFGRSMHAFLASFSPGGNANETQSSSGSSKGQDTSLPKDEQQGISQAILVVAIVVPVIIFIALLALSLWLWRRRRHASTRLPVEEDHDVTDSVVQPYAYSTITTTTSPPPSTSAATELDVAARDLAYRLDAKRTAAHRPERPEDSDDGEEPAEPPPTSAKCTAAYEPCERPKLSNDVQRC